MKLKRLIIISLLVMVLFIGAVSAANETDTLSNDDTGDELSVSDETEPLQSTTNFEGTTFTELEGNISSASDGDVINLKNDIKQTGSDEIVIDKSITIEGNGHTVDAQNKSRIFNIVADNVVLKNIIFINANVNGENGGAIKWSGANGTVINSHFINNTANGKWTETGWTYGLGGAIYSNSVNLKVNGSAFKNNTGIHGGAIYIENGVVNNTIYNSNFTGHHVVNYGGAIYAKGKYSLLYNCVFTNNSGIYGGALYTESTADNFTISNCEFTYNEARGANPAKGGAIYVGNTNLEIKNTILLYNKALTNNIESESANGELNITFKGWENLFNALFLDDKVNQISYNNITYWNGEIVNSDSYPQEKSMNEIGVNITLDIYKVNVIGNNTLIKTLSNLTNDEGIATFDYSFLTAGNYLFSYYHPEDCYYTNQQSTLSMPINISFTRLQKLIDETEENGTLTLENDFAYDATIDENMTKGVLINKTITINGNGCALDGLHKEYRIFNITADNVILTNIIFTRGGKDYGRAIYWSGNNGTVINCTFYNNYLGRTNLKNGTVYWAGDNGKVINSTFIGNNARHGGAIYWTGVNGIIINSNFTNNTAPGYGGAVFTNSSDLKITCCQFTNNTVSLDVNYKGKSYGKAIYIGDGNLILSNSLFKLHEDDEIYNNGILFLENNTLSRFIKNTGTISSKTNITVLDNKTVMANPGNVLLTAVILDDNNNIIISQIAPVFSIDKTNSTSSLDENGTYYTEYTFDNAGTYTVSAAVSGLDNSEAYTGTVFIGGDFVILQKLIDDAQEGSTINLTRNYTYTIGEDTVTEGILINKNITINANGYTINAQGKSRIFKITSTATLENVTLINGNATNGGAVYIDYTAKYVIIKDASFKNNNATKWGGAIYFESDGEICNCEFTYNMAGYDGGAVKLTSVVTNIYNSTFTNNTATVMGGAIRSEATKSTISNSKFTNNSAKEGGAINWNGHKSTISNSEFTSNEASVAGGAIMRAGNDGLLSNSTFTNNNAPDGGAIFNQGEYTIKDSAFTGNNISEIYNQGTRAKLTLKNTTVSRFIYNYNIILSEITVTVLDNSPMEINKNTEVNLTAVIKDDNGNIIIQNKELKFTVNGQSIGIASVDENGVYYLNYTFDQNGEYTISISTTGLDNATIKTALILVGKDPNMNVTAPSEGNYGKNVTVTITLPEDARENVTVNGQTIVLNETFNGTLIYSLSGLHGGENNITVTYSGDDVYRYDETTKPITVTPADITINDNLKVDNATYKTTDEVKVNGAITSNIENGANYTGELLVYISGYSNINKTVSVNTDGTFEAALNLSGTALDVGKYNIYIKVIGNENYTGNEKEFDGCLIVDPANLTVSEITVQPVQYAFDDTVNVTGKLTDTTSANVTLTVENNNITVKSNENGYFEAIITLKEPLALGTYDVLTNVSGNNNYRGIEKTFKNNLSVVKATPTIVSLTITDAIYKTTETVTVKGSVDTNVKYGENYTGPINISVEGHPNINASAVVGKDGSFEAVLNISTLSPGQYNVVCDVEGNENYTAASYVFTNNLTVSKITAEIEDVSVTATVYGKNVPIYITGKVTNNYTGEVTVSIEGYNQTVRVNESGYFNASVQLTQAINAGQYDVNITVMGNENYSTVNKTFKNSLTVAKTKVEFGTTASDALTYGRGNDLTVQQAIMSLIDDNFGEKYNGTVTMTFNKYSISLNTSDDNICKFNFILDEAVAGGTHNAIFAVEGNENYSPANQTINIIINTATVYIENITAKSNGYGSDKITVNGNVISNIDHTFGINYTGQITVEVYNNNNGFSISNTSYVSEDTSFIVVFNLNQTLEIGEYSIMATIDGNENYTRMGRILENELKITKANTTLDEITVGTIVYGNSENVTVTGKLTNPSFGVTGNITVEIEGQNTTVELNENGYFEATVPIIGLEAGSYDVSVSIPGNENYTAFSKTFKNNLTIAKANVTIDSLTCDENIYGLSAKIIIQGMIKNNSQYSNPYDGNITITIGNYTVNAALTSDGPFYGEIDLSSPMNAGEYNVTVTIMGNNNYNKMNVTYPGKLIVNKTNAVIKSITVDSIVYGENNTVTIKGNIASNITSGLGLNYTDKITAAILNTAYSNFTTVNDDGSFEITINLDDTYIKAGQYDINITIEGNDNYKTSNKVFTNNLTVEKATIAIESVENITVIYGVNNTVYVTGKIETVKYGVNYTSEIKVKIEDINATGSALNGDFSVAVTGVQNLPVGDHTIAIMGSETENYTEISKKTATFKVIKSQFEIDANITGVSEGSVKVDQNATVTIDISNIPPSPFNTTGEIIINVTGIEKNYTVKVPVENNTIQLDIIATPGTYTLNVQYTGNKNYNASEIVTKTFIVTKWNETDLQALINNSTGNVTLEHDYEFTNENATVNVTNSTVINGNGHTINANGSSTALNITADNVTVDNVTVSNVNGTGIISNGTNTTISNVELNNVNGTGIITSGNNTAITNATLNNVTESGIISQGENATIDNTEMNNINGTAITTMGDNTTVSNTTLNNVNGTGIASSGANTTINNTEMNNITGTGIVSVGDNSTISNTSLSNVNGTGIDSDAPNTNINNTNLENVNGTAIQINGDNPTVNNVNAANTTGTLMNITGDNISITNVNSTNNSTILLDGKVNKTENITGATIIPSIRATSSVVKNDVIITATVSSTEGSVTVQFEGVSYTVPLKDGKATITIPNVGPGTYENVPVKYDGTRLYQNVSTTTSFTSKAAITENKDVTIDYLSGYEYTVRVMNADGTYSAGTAVTFTVNGITYTRNTDSNGYAKLLIELKPKTYTITTKFLNIKKTNKIKVKYTLKLVKKTVKVKKTAKKLVLKAKLKWSSGKAIKGKVVKFKFKGKTYKAKTNSKGIAKVTIKKKVIKKLKKGKKYKFWAKYVNEYRYGKVKVKK